MQSHPLDGDGINPEFFKMMGKVSKTTVLSAGFPFRVPDTVLYYGCASFWYYFDEATMTVQKHPAKFLDKQTIFDAFKKLKKTDKCEIVAIFIPWRTLRLDVTYMNEAQLAEFLFRPGKRERFGILQKFVHPHSEHIETTQVVFSPKLSFAERRVNNSKIYDRTVEPRLRCCGFDGPSYQCSEHYCLDHLKNIYASMCDAAVAFFESVEGAGARRYSIGRMVAYFRQDAQDEYWLLFTTSIRIVEKLDPEAKNNILWQKDAFGMYEILDPKVRKRRQGEGTVQPLVILSSQNPSANVASNKPPLKKKFLPPPARLLSPFMTPSLEEDGEEEPILSYAVEIDRRMRAREEKMAKIEEENGELNRALKSLEHDVRTLSNSLPTTCQPRSRCARLDATELEATAAASSRTPSPSYCGINKMQSMSVYSVVNISSPSPTLKRRKGKHNSGLKLPDKNQHVFEPSATCTLAGRMLDASYLSFGEALYREGMDVAAQLSDVVYPVSELISWAKTNRQTNRGRDARPAWDIAGSSAKVRKVDGAVQFLIPRKLLLFAERYLSSFWRDLSLDYEMHGEDEEYSIISDDLVDPLSHPDDAILCVCRPPFHATATLPFIAGTLQELIGKEKERFQKTAVLVKKRITGPSHESLFFELRNAHTRYKERCEEKLTCSFVSSSTPSPSPTSPKVFTGARAAILSQIRQGFKLRNSFSKEESSGRSSSFPRKVDYGSARVKAKKFQMTGVPMEMSGTFSQSGDMDGRNSPQLDVAPADLFTSLAEKDGKPVEEKEGVDTTEAPKAEGSGDISHDPLNTEKELVTNGDASKPDDISAPLNSDPTKQEPEREMDEIPESVAAKSTEQTRPPTPSNPEAGSEKREEVTDTVQPDKVQSDPDWLDF